MRQIVPPFSNLISARGRPHISVLFTLQVETKMKTKKNRKDGQRITPGQHKNMEPLTDSSNSSAHSLRRSSKRIQNMQKSAVSPGQLGLVDSAYDADEESVTPSSSPEQVKQNKDPYEMDMTDDEAPAVITKQRRKKDPKKANKQLTTKKQKKSKDVPLINKKANPTSTPVLHSSGDLASKLDNSQSLSGTPEVTPILPYKPHEAASLSVSFATPQVHRPSKKRSLQPDSFTNLSTQLSYSTPGDSGIALSPVSKKHCSLYGTEKSVADLESEDSVPQKSVTEQQRHHSNALEEHMHVRKKNIFSPINEINTPDLHKNVKIAKKAKYEDDSCFGFDSLTSPLIALENSPKPRRLKNAKTIKKMTLSKDSYRLKHTNSSDSSVACVTNEFRLSLESESSQENLAQTKPASPRAKSASPTLFSDSFSADSESLEKEVNKSTAKVYKPSKVRRIKENVNVSKLDVWANNFNMEIEDIEKFDLNIE